MRIRKQDEAFSTKTTRGCQLYIAFIPELVSVIPELVSVIPELVSGENYWGRKFMVGWHSLTDRQRVM